ncbi:MAG: hypothetical protein AB1485_03335 [Candidatus Thermoplasmatota archaeon]
MKIGLRMDECFSIFKMRIVGLTNNRYTQTKISDWVSSDQTKMP